MKLFFQAFFLALMLFGCMVGPNYKPPEVSIEEKWDSLGVEGQEEILTKWWEIFGDPLLTRYVQEASQSNQNVLIAEARILEARGLRQVEASALFPHLLGDFNVSKTYFSKSGPIFAGPSLTGGISPTTGLPFAFQAPQKQTLYNALIDATWEIDLFGKTRRAVEAANAEIESAMEQKNDILLSVFAEIAMNFMELRSSQRLGLLIEENIELLEKKAQIERARFKMGYNNRLEVEKIESELFSERAQLPDVLAQIFRNIYAISVLVGKEPEALLEELLPIAEFPQLPEKILVGLRSDLLRRRPDVRRSERQFAAATARVGVAVASFFPTITLNGDIGLQALKWANLFTARSKTWSFGGDVGQPIFQGGQLMGNLKTKEALAAAASYNFQQIVLSALQEAESSIITYKNDLVALGHTGASVEKQEIISALTNERYAKGLVGLSDSIDSERQLNSAHQSLLNSKKKALLDLIALYKSLGGGWEREVKDE